MGLAKKSYKKLEDNYMNKGANKPPKPPGPLLKQKKSDQSIDSFLKQYGPKDGKIEPKYEKGSKKMGLQSSPKAKR